MPPKNVKSVIVPKNKRARQVTTTQQGPPTKRTHSNASEDIVMTITQLVSDKNHTNNTSKKKPTQSQAQEVGNSHMAASIAHPSAGVQHASNAAPYPGQYQPTLQQSSPPWWAWGPPQPSPPWNWNMWSPGAFQQLTVPNANANQQLLNMATPQRFAILSTSQPIPHRKMMQCQVLHSTSKYLLF